MKKFLTLLFLASCSVGSYAQTVYADVDGDGFVTTADVTAIYNVLLGVTPNMNQYEVNGVLFNMIEVSGGTFMMGATEEQGSNVGEAELPVHQVTLSSFRIGQTEVTQELWRAVMGSNPSYCNEYGNADYGSDHPINYGYNPKRPVEYVSWEECQTFIAKLNEMTGQNFRLPTEAEWEYAARGGNKSKGYRYAGSDNLDDVAWYRENSWETFVGTSEPQYLTHSVALRPANELGLYDMSGNVWEWCSDWFGNYSSSSQTNPQGPSSGTFHTARGGGIQSFYWSCRLSYRGTFPPNQHDVEVGLRLAL